MCKYIITYVAPPAFLGMSCPKFLKGGAPGSFNWCLSTIRLSPNPDTKFKRDVSFQYNINK